MLLWRALSVVSCAQNMYKNFHSFFSYNKKNIPRNWSYETCNFTREPPEVASWELSRVRPPATAAANSWHFLFKLNSRFILQERSERGKHSSSGQTRCGTTSTRLQLLPFFLFYLRFRDSLTAADDVLPATAAAWELGEISLQVCVFCRFASEMLTRRLWLTLFLSVFLIYTS